MSRRALLYAACFAGLAATAATVTGRIAEPAVTALLLAMAAAGTLAGGRRAGPPTRLAARAAPVPVRRVSARKGPGAAAARLSHGAGGQLAFYAGAAAGRRRSPMPGTSSRSSSPDRRACDSCCRWSSTPRSGLAAFLALSLRRPLPAIVVLLILLGFGFTTDAHGEERLGRAGVPPAGGQHARAARAPCSASAGRSTDVSRRARSPPSSRPRSRSRSSARPPSRPAGP